jgi:heme/copper-type cytochrome/quinol oxidase subunit 1
MQDFLHIPFMVMTELISIPTGVVFLSAVGTLWMGRLHLKTPMLFALGVTFNFLIGGITGIYLADVTTDVHLQDTYFVVAHFHYTMMGGEIFAIMAAVYYWFPKITGRMYNETLGRVHFWWMMVFYNVWCTETLSSASLRSCWGQSFLSSHSTWSIPGSEVKSRRQTHGMPRLWSGRLRLLRLSRTSLSHRW